MLLRSGRLPTSGDYAFEPKWDGFRALVSRNGHLRVKRRRALAVSLAVTAKAGYEVMAWELSPSRCSVGGS